MSGIFNLKDREISLFTANEAMRVVLDGLDNDVFKIIDIVSGDMIDDCQDDKKWIEYIEKMDAVVPGDVKFLEKAGIYDKKIVKETSAKIFVKMLLRYMTKNNKKVFIISVNHENLLKVKDRLKGYGRGLVIEGMSVAELTGRSEDVIINEINAMDPDCIISVMPSPKQEEFISSNRAFINGRVWIGCGCILSEENPQPKRKKLFNFLKNL